MSKPGHNSGPIAADRLKSFIERIEKLEHERKELNEDIKGVYSEAKRIGYDVKTMRKIVQLRAMDAADRAEAETLLDTYCHALGMVYVSADFSEEALVEQASRIASEVDRCMDLVIDGEPLPSIGAIRELIGCSTGKASKLRGLVAERISRSEAKVREMKQPEDGDDGITESCGGVESRHAVEAGKTRDQRAATGAPELVGSAVPLDRVSAAGQMQPGVTVPTAGVAPGPHDASLDLAHNEVQPSAPVSVGAVARPSSDERVASSSSDEMPPIPDFLRRQTEAGV